MKNVKRFLAKTTLTFRHKIVKFIAPRIYAGFRLYKQFTVMPRPMMLFVKNHYFLDGELVGVEIGVAAGENALNMLELLPVKKLYLIDPYIPYVQNGKQTDYSEFKEIAKQRLKKFPQAVFIEKTSEEAVKDIPEILDFVYIDGNHDYEYVKKDIELYYPLVRKGGVIGGHDYVPTFKGVIKAVNEFAEDHSLVLGKTIFIEPPDWWIVKSE